MARSLALARFLGCPARRRAGKSVISEAQRARSLAGGSARCSAQEELPPEGLSNAKGCL